MKTALILGCSHAAGTEIWKQPGLILGNENFIDYGKKHSYATVLATKLGYQARNLAEAALSNDAMFRIWEAERSTLTSQDLVIACWTGCNRTEVWNQNQGTWQPIIAGDLMNQTELAEAHRQWTLWFADEMSGKNNKVKNILALNAQSHNLGIPVINIDSFWKLDYDWPSTCYWPEASNFTEWCSQQKYDATEWGHYFAPAHEQFAKHVVTGQSLQQYLQNYQQ